MILITLILVLHEHLLTFMSNICRLFGIVERLCAHEATLILPQVEAPRPYHCYKICSKTHRSSIQAILSTYPTVQVCSYSVTCFKQFVVSCNLMARFGWACADTKGWSIVPKEMKSLLVEPFENGGLMLLSYQPRSYSSKDRTWTAMLSQKFVKALNS